MMQTASTIKKVSMELGGNAPFIVFDDADLDAAVEGAIVSKYRNAGQTCVCSNRLYVHTRVYDAFAEKLVAAVTALKVGDGAEEGVRIGPLIDTKAVVKVEEHIADALAKGARILCGGKRHARGHSFFEPTVLADVKPRHAGGPRGNVWPDGAPLPLRDRRRSDRNGKRYGVRPGKLLLFARSRPRVAGRCSGRW